MNNLYGKKKEKKEYDKIIFYVLLIIECINYFFLVCKQGTSNGKYISDIGPYIEEVLGTNSKFDYPYPILFKTTALLNVFLDNPYVSMALVVTTLNCIAIVLTKKEIDKLTEKKLVATFATFILFKVSMIIVPCFLNHGLTSIYAGVFSPNPWQNQTYMAARPFMIMAFIYGVYTTKNYVLDLSERMVQRKYILLSISLLLVTLAKPAYTLPHMCSVFIIAIYKLLKSKGKTFIASCKLLIYYIPTVCALLYQYGGVFRGVSYTGEENGIGISVGRAWAIWVDNIPLAIILAGAFPLIVLVFHLNMVNISYEFFFSWMIYFTGLVMALLLYEKGFREQDFNFAWGYICGLFFVFMTALVVYIQDWCMYFSEGRQHKYKYVLVTETVFLLAHFVSGVIYYIYILLGGFYY